MSDRGPEGADERELGGDGEIEETEGEILDEGDTGDGEAEEGGDEAEGELEEEPERVLEPRRESRRDRAARELREETSRLKTELAELRGQVNRPAPADPQANERAEREFQERLQQMDPISAIAAVRDRERQVMGQALNQVRGELLDRSDKADFNAAQRSDPAMKRLAPEVERIIAQARGQGNFALERMTVFDSLYGREMRLKRQEAEPKQRREGQRRIAQQTTRPGSARGDAVRTRRPEGDSVEASRARIAGRPLW